MNYTIARSYLRVYDLGFAKANNVQPFDPDWISYSEDKRPHRNDTQQTYNSNYTPHGSIHVENLGVHSLSSVFNVVPFRSPPS